MMEALRLAWEPKNIAPLALIEERMMQYHESKNSGVTILTNGTLLFTPNGRDDNADAKKAMNEAKLLIDFNVVEMKSGDYLVKFHPAIAVFVSEDEFKSMQYEIQLRLSYLKFPDEFFIQEKIQNSNNLMIGLYARGKLQFDAYHFSFYKRLQAINRHHLGE